MEPLRQWICDVCGKVIEKPEDGYVVWGTNEEGKIDKIRILHKNNHVDGYIIGCDHEKLFVKGIFSDMQQTYKRDQCYLIVSPAYMFSS